MMAPDVRTYEGTSRWSAGQFIEVTPYPMLLMLALYGFTGAVIRGLTLPFALWFRSPTETLRVSFRLDGLFGAMATFPRGNVPLPFYENCKNKYGSGTRLCAAITSIQLAVCPIVDNFAAASYAIIRLKTPEPWFDMQECHSSI